MIRQKCRNIEWVYRWSLWILLLSWRTKVILLQESLKSRNLTKACNLVHKVFPLLRVLWLKGNPRHYAQLRYCRGNTLQVKENKVPPAFSNRGTAQHMHHRSGHTQNQQFTADVWVTPILAVLSASLFPIFSSSRSTFCVNLRILTSRWSVWKHLRKTFLSHHNKKNKLIWDWHTNGT